MNRKTTESLAERDYGEFMKELQKEFPDCTLEQAARKLFAEHKDSARALAIIREVHPESTLEQGVTRFRDDRKAAIDTAFLYYWKNVDFNTALDEVLGDTVAHYRDYDRIRDVIARIAKFRAKNLCDRTQAQRLARAEKVIRLGVGELHRKRGTKRPVKAPEAPEEK